MRVRVLVVTYETVANMDVGGRADREVPAACLISNYHGPDPVHDPRISGRAHFPPLGVLIRIGYAAFMRDFTDEQLMQRYANGDAKAFDQLYDRHRGPLYRYFNRQVSDMATANDLYQGAWEKIIKSRKKYRSTAPFTAWMYKIAHNHLVDHYRRTRSTDAVENDTMADDRANPQKDIIEDEHREKLRKGIIALPPEQRDTLLLQLETGLKLEDIAMVTGVSRETVKSRLRYAVNKLKQVLIE